MGEIYRRPDLEAQEVSFPDYISDKIFPFWGKPQIAGEYYYQKYKADKTAQYNRNTATLADIDNNIIAANSETFSCKELRARISMGYTQLKGYFDKEHADLAMGRLAKRAWFNKVENLTANTLLGADDVVDGTSDPVTTIDTQVSLLRDKGIGRIALVTSNANKIALKRNEIIIERMKATGLGAYELKEIRNVGDMNLGAALGVDYVLTGKDEVWYAGVTGEAKGNMALIVMPEEEVDPAEAFQLGRIIYFRWADSEADKFIMESWHWNLKDAEVVDAKGLIDLQFMNPELASVIKVFNTDASDSSSN